MSGAAAIDPKIHAPKKSMNSLEQIRLTLGTPYFQSDNVLLYQGDCLELLASLPTGCIPLTVTSPPYNIGKEYEVVRELEDYIDWCEKWIGEIFRVSTPNASFWLNLGYIALANRAKAIPLPYLLWNRIPFFLIQEVVWNYAAGVAGKKFFSPRNEKLLWYVKNAEDYVFNLDAVRDPDVKYPNQKKNGKLRCNPLGKNPSDVWQISKVTSGKDRAAKERTPHPAQFPVALVRRTIEATSNPNDLVLDPFMGSGSLAEAALRSNRHVVGFEINPEYLSIATQRIKAVAKELADEDRQSTLFNSTERRV